MAVVGAKGSAPTDQYKVSATYQAGFRAEGFLLIFGERAREKAEKCAAVILARLERAGCKPECFTKEVLGAGEAVKGAVSIDYDPIEVMLRVCVQDPDKAKVTRFTKELAPLVTSGPQGVSGYATGRPRIRPQFGYWPCLIDTDKVQVETKILCPVDA